MISENCHYETLFFEEATGFIKKFSYFCFTILKLWLIQSAFFNLQKNPFPFQSENRFEQSNMNLLKIKNWKEVIA